MPTGLNRGVLLIDLKGTQLTAEENQLLSLPGVAGIVLFSRNYQSREQLIALIRSVRDVRRDLLICVDQEGGRVQRFKDGFTRLPPAQAYGVFDPDLHCHIAYESGWLMASELLACGVDLCLGPVLDIDHGKTSIVGDRAFGCSVEQVTQLASLWVDGVHEAGMSVVIKHFPGHGNVDSDSHVSLPLDDRTFDEICQSDMEPFRVMIRKGVEALMPAHILFPAIDQYPVGYSPEWLKRVLRNQLSFDGLVISDCLSMEGAAKTGSYPARARAALDAGCDLLIICNRQGVLEVLAEIDGSGLQGVGPGDLMPASYTDWASLENSERYREVRKMLARAFGAG
ncbi:beta-N-acetylhexosaminidase [Endozoicomonas sp. YOMI1]|uniref:beta-N-acetylhexosaminidase n=1 Tax=Endozoicomonas sp. YOMI1 TaxID=2828739 RepID=UPI0021482387|nr:beta-N-acetylhexosaminidase [Endozoicomonas sp. YOMI1]